MFFTKCGTTSSVSRFVNDFRNVLPGISDCIFPGIFIFCAYATGKQKRPSVREGRKIPRCHPDLSLRIRITARPVKPYFPQPTLRFCSGMMLRSHVPLPAPTAFHPPQLSDAYTRQGTLSFIACDIITTSLGDCQGTCWQSEADL